MAAIDVVWEAATARRSREQQQDLMGPEFRPIIVPAGRIIRRIVHRRDRHIFAVLLIEIDGRVRAVSIQIDLSGRYPVRAVDLL